MLASVPLLVNVDPLRIEQVVINLLDNAFKFSPGSEPIELEVSATSAAMARLDIRDHGIGIPPDNREKIFDRFYQAHASDHRSGLGLGLFISREIVELHSGRIMVEFPPDGGTRFIVELPLWVAETSGR
jgi:signal transduction histidine kinase